MIWVGGALIDQGYDVKIELDRTYKARWRSTHFGERIEAIVQPLDADIIVIQRPLHRNRYELLAALKAKGARVVVEIDDNFHAIHPGNPAWKGANPLSDPDVSNRWLQKACDIADLVTCSTPALAEQYGQHGRVAVLPNYVPESYIGLSKVESRENVVVGWSGSVATHPKDLDQTQGAVAEAVLAAGASFDVIGTGKGVKKGLGLLDHPSSTGWLPLDEYPQALAALDIGIVPLKPSAFNEAKSALKMMELAAVGAVPVGSPTWDNRRMHAAGIGMLAETRDDWYTAVYKLATDPTLRSETAIQSREVMKDYTIEKNAYRWWEAWQSAT